jgi:hypothetical protein
MPNWGELKRRAEKLRGEIAEQGRAILSAIEAKDQEKVNRLRAHRAVCERELKAVEAELANET